MLLRFGPFLLLLSVPCLSMCSSGTVTCAVLRVPSFLRVVVSGRVDPLFGQVWGTLSAPLARALLTEELDGAATLRYYPRTAAEDMADTIGQEIGQGVVASTFRRDISCWSIPNSPKDFGGMYFLEKCSWLTLIFFGPVDACELSASTATSMDSVPSWQRFPGVRGFMRLLGRREQTTSFVSCVTPLLGVAQDDAVFFLF